MPNNSPLNKFELITHEDILEATSKLKNGASPGIDNISSNLLKKYINFLVKPLTHLFNLCITQNKIPDVFKVAIITPIYKKGLTSLISNFRPISVISNVAKIFEKIIKARLVHYLESKNLLFEHQYGFRPDKSTDQAIANVTKIIYSTLEEGKKCATIYLDLAKAFDTVDHVKLLKKMHDIGITGSAHSLFESYLEKRKQRVKINDTISCEQTIICGVPQGITLSPVLFNIQLNDIKLLNLNSNIICYADDTVLICNGLTWEEVFTNIEADLLSIKIWFKKNNLFLNLDKSAILLHSLSECTLPTLNELKIHECKTLLLNHCQCKSVSIVKNYKYLGIEMCHDMKWKNQIINTTNKLRKMIFIMKSLCEILDCKDIKLIYLTLFEPLIAYGIIGWGSAYDNVLSRLQKCQNTIIRVACNKQWRYPTKQLYEEFNVLNIYKLYIKTCTIFLKKHNMLFPVNHKVNTRYATNNYSLKFPKKAGCRKVYDFVGTHIHNIMPKEVADMSLSIFKKYITHWLHHEYDATILKFQD